MQKNETMSRAGAPPAQAIDEMSAALRAALDPISEVAAGLLFGSWATGRNRPDSDVDLAVLLDPPPSDADRYEQTRRLLIALGGHVAVERLDLVLLCDAPPALAFQVLKDGKVILCRDPVVLHRFRVDTYRRHADYEPVQRLFRRATRARALGESAHINSERDVPPPAAARGHEHTLGV